VKKIERRVVRTSVPEGYAKEIGAFHRPYWEALRGSVGWIAVGESVARLLHQGYCDAEIAPMFGVSRERVRQWRAKYGLRAIQSSKARVWDDETNMFRAVSTDEWEQHERARLQRLRQQRRKQRHRGHRSARQWLVSMLADLHI